MCWNPRRNTYIKISSPKTFNDRRFNELINELEHAQAEIRTFQSFDGEKKFYEKFIKDRKATVSHCKQQLKELKKTM